LYRVDKFAVPAEGRDEFLAAVARTHELLRKQDGFLQDLILEQLSGPGIFNFVTLAEWTAPEAIERASRAVADLHKQIGFDRQEFMSRLGVKADIGTYKRLHL
jgi:heme-degrading monooxygenase HmoA